MLVWSLHCILAHMTFLNLNLLLSDWLLLLYILSWRIGTNTPTTINAHKTGSKSNNELKQSCLLVLVLIKVIVRTFLLFYKSYELCSDCMDLCIIHGAEVWDWWLVRDWRDEFIHQKDMLIAPIRNTLYELAKIGDTHLSLMTNVHCLKGERLY